MAEVLVGLLQRDPNSYLYLDPAWKPAPPIASDDRPIHIRRPAEIRRRCLIARAHPPSLEVGIKFICELSKQSGAEPNKSDTRRAVVEPA